jgi:hypothetical protein
VKHQLDQARVTGIILDQQRVNSPRGSRLLSAFLLSCLGNHPASLLSLLALSKWVEPTKHLTS